MTERIIRLPNSETILSDLDNTLVEGGFNVNTQEIFSTIAKIQSHGLKIGLSSDTPYEALEIWRNRFGMIGPVIAEKGAVVCTDSGLIYNKEDSLEFARSIEYIAKILTDKGFVIWYGNPVEALRTDLHLGNSGDKVALINNIRRCSIGLFFRVAGQGGRLFLDRGVTNLAMKEIKNAYPKFDLDEDFNEQYGLVILARRGTNKRNGTKILMNTMNVAEVGMIGDSMSDYLGTDIAKHYAVQNASNEYKAHAEYVSNERLTLGVTEILNRLIKDL